MVFKRKSANWSLFSVQFDSFDSGHFGLAFAEPFGQIGRNNGLAFSCIAAIRTGGHGWDYCSDTMPGTPVSETSDHSLSGLNSLIPPILTSCIPRKISPGNHFTAMGCHPTNKLSIRLDSAARRRKFYAKSSGWEDRRRATARHTTGRHKDFGSSTFAVFDH